MLIVAVVVAILALQGDEQKRFRRKVQYIFQDPLHAGGNIGKAPAVLGAEVYGIVR